MGDIDPHLVKTFLPPAFAIFFVGIALTLYYLSRRSKTEPDIGQFVLTNWKLEEELALNEPPRSVRPKDVSSQKKRYYFLLTLPIVFVLVGFLIFAPYGSIDPTDVRTKGFLPFLFLPAFVIFIAGLTIYRMKRKVENDLNLLVSGSAIGARVVAAYRQKSQYSYRLKFALDGKIHERVAVDRFQYIHRGAVLKVDDEVTVIVDPGDLKSIVIYCQMLAEVRTDPAF